MPKMLHNKGLAPSGKISIFGNVLGTRPGRRRRKYDPGSSGFLPCWASGGQRRPSTMLECDICLTRVYPALKTVNALFVRHAEVGTRNWDRNYARTRHPQFRSPSTAKPSWNMLRHKRRSKTGEKMSERPSWTRSANQRIRDC